MEDLSSAQAKVRRELWRLKRAEAREEQKVANHQMAVTQAQRDEARSRCTPATSQLQPAGYQAEKKVLSQ
jgi:hypothetical protein